jgi:hypothetical protein
LKTGGWLTCFVGSFGVWESAVGRLVPSERGSALAVNFPAANVVLRVANHLQILDVY